MSKLQRYCILFVVLFLGPTLHAQQSYWEVSASLGKMNTNNFEYRQYSRPTFGVEVAWWNRTEGDQWWMQRWRNPSFGLKVSYAHIPDGIAGDRMGVVGLLRVPIFVPWLEWNIGPGFSFYSGAGELTGNKENIFISSLLNCLIDLGIQAHVSDHVTLGVRLLHTSNGMLKRPNMGLNYIQFDAGWKINYKRNVFSVAGAPGAYSKHEVGFMVSPGLVMSRHSMMESYYPCYDLSLNYQYYLDPVVSVGATVDLWFNGSHWKQFPWYHDNYPVPLYLSMMPVAEGFWGPVSLKVGIGPVLLASSLVKIRFYERVGVYYNWGKNYVGVGVNAHAGQVEFIEWSYGRRFSIGG